MKAVIFDLDGVLVDSQLMHYEADILVLKYAGVNCGRDVVEKYAGVANRERWPKYCADFALKQSAAELGAEHARILDGLLDTSDIMPIPGVREALVHIKDKGMRMAVASSSSLAYINKVLTRVGLIDFFDVITSGTEAARGKPAPDVFLLAAERLGVPPEECVVVEDSENGVKAAKAAHIRCVGYVSANSGIQDLSPADTVIGSFDNPGEWLK